VKSRLIHDRFDLSLGAGLGKLKGRMFRIGHLGDSNDLTLMAALSGVEIGLSSLVFRWLEMGYWPQWRSSVEGRRLLQGKSLTATETPIVAVAGVRTRFG